MRCSVLLVLVICLAAALASRHHPRHVVLRGHPTINTESEPSYSEESYSSSKSQFIVHMRGPVHHDDVASLEKDLGVTFDSYLPHNSFLMFAPSSVAKAARLHRLVLWVGAYRPEYKISTDIISAIEALPKETTVVNLDVTTVRLTAKELVQTVNELFAAIPTAVISPAAENVLNVIVSRKIVRAAIDALASVAAVHTIDLSAETVSIESHTFVSQVVEYGDNNLTPVTASGLDGTGQIIGSGDSGLSVRSCLFWDPITGFATSSRVFQSTTHRKLVLYNSTYGDFVDGTAHGTAAIGAAAGEYFVATDTLNNYEGQAPGAKVAFMDLQAGSNLTLNIPADLATNYFGPLVAAGAKVILNAWGSYNSRKQYTVQEQAVDAYLAANPTVIAVFSAGNDGAKGTGSISSPGSSKNAIAVGASQNLAAGFEDALNTAPITDLYNNYVTRLCTGANAVGANSDALWRDQTFCQGVAGNNAPCDASDQTQVCGVLQGPSGCCAFSNYEPFVGLSGCCVQTFLDVFKNSASYSLANVASFSSRGPTFDGRIKPDVMAPGESVKTPAATNTVCPATLTDADRAAAVTVSSGTSIAAGVAAGAVAQVRQYFVDGYYPLGFENSGPSIEPESALVKAVLVAGATELSAISGSFKGLGAATWGSTSRYDAAQGFGRIELANSLLLNSTNFNSPFIWTVESGSLSTGGVWSKCLQFAVGATMPINIAIAWTDPAASPSAGVALVNNLDLSVSYQDNADPQIDERARGASVIYPNGLGQPDSFNNVERISVDPSPTKKYVTVRVFGANVPKGPQKFWIVITGEYTVGCSGIILCPRSCSGAGNCDTTSGTCNCTTAGVTGPECTAALTCGSLGNCSGNGVCNIAGQCICASGFDGSDCQNNVVGSSTSTSTSGRVTKKSGISTGVFVGVVIALFFFGCILALFIGVFGGLKYAEWRRQKAKAKANRMLSNDSRL